MKLSTRDVAFTAVFAALTVIVCKTIPGIPIIGVPEANIKFDAAIAPIYGMIIGPYLGFLAALLGGLIAAGSPFSVLTSFCPAVSALVAGFLTRGKGEQSRVPGWILASVVMGLLIAGWYTTWVGQQAPLYPVLHFAGLFAVLITRGRTANAFGEMGLRRSEGWRVRPGYVLCGLLAIAFAYMFSKKPYSGWVWVLPYLSLPLYFFAGVLVFYGIFGGGRVSFASSVFLASYAGIIADHMLGNIIFINVIDVLIPMNVVQDYFLEPLGLPDIPSLFMYMIPISAVERILLTVIATLFGVGLILVLYRARLLPRKTVNTSAR